ncbi:hypothetical protein RO3G_01895 [Rhizopus delemar RA 99-880]|uniref:Uncharacterized protein n=1 Tax=Rhizopus delemar (strain RA 99-880 / ATCC MYA-4621 / FGSC 9543 / NRRL 43880) TaxID=246409 RepID=I1BLW1_RHIO9|nr:hypothetical protein RO3G_01895 [Rhizopus delemar RA 99-880]|eukprot:EIE77191.1 hypothetical protein RO3G_01895 [Rhizopus delemar RA 99-880]
MIQTREYLWLEPQHASQKPSPSSLPSSFSCKKTNLFLLNTCYIRGRILSKVLSSDDAMAVDEYEILLTSIKGHEPMDYIIDQNEFIVKTMIAAYLKTVGLQ